MVERLLNSVPINNTLSGEETGGEYILIREKESTF